MRLSLDKFTKSALKEMLEDALFKEAERSKPIHRRGDKKPEKDDATEDRDDENDKLVELDRERGEPEEVELDDEDFSDEAMDAIKQKKAAKKRKA